MKKNGLRMRPDILMCSIGGHLYNYARYILHIQRQAFRERLAPRTVGKRNAKPCTICLVST